MMFRDKIPNNLYIYLLIGAIAACIAIFSSYTQLQKIYKDYWGAPGQQPQGTIYSVQTVEFNIANTSMPITAAQAVIDNNIEYLNQIAESGYGLVGFIITECSNGSTRDNCLDEEVLANTTWGFNWINEENIKSFIQNSDYAILTSDPSTGIEWHYEAPKVDNIIKHDFEQKGDIIGRLYYVRRPAPSFSEQWSLFIERLWHSDNMAIKYFMSVVGTHFFAFFTFSLLLYLFYRVGRKNALAIEEKNELSNRLRESEDELAKSIAEKNKISEKYDEAASNIENLRASQSLEKEKQEELQYKIIKQKENIALEKSKSSESQSLNDELLEELEANLKASEEEQAERERVLKTTSDELTKISQQRDEFYKKAELQEEKLKESASEIEQLKLSISRRKSTTTLSEKAVDAFIMGLNITSQNTLKMHPDVYNDIKRLEKHKSISYESIINTLSRIAKVDASDDSFTRTFELLKGYKNVYHSKQQKIRIYFRRTTGETELLGMWDQSEAPHSRGDKHWRTLNSRTMR